MEAAFFNRLKKRSGSGLMLLMSLCLSAAAQQQMNPRFSRYTINNGLSENLVYAITQDRQGFMWFGTQDGLDRFDGYEFTVFRHNPFDTTSLSDNTIISLYTDSKGRLWIGTMHSGLDLYDPGQNNFIHFLTHRADSGKISGDYVESITEDKKGNLWVGTFGNGLFEFVFPQSDTGYYPNKIIHYIHQPGDSTSLGNNYVLSVFADSKGRLWTSYIDGPMQMARLNQKKPIFITPRFTFINPKQIILKNQTKFNIKVPTWVKYKKTIGGGRVAFMEQQHQLWMGTSNGLCLIKDNSDTLIRFDFSQPWAKQGTVLSICEAPGKGNSAQTLWTGTYYGLQVFSTKDYTLKLIKNEPLNKESLVGGRILKIYKDRSGCIWLGSNGYGMSKYDYHSALFSAPQFATADNKTKTSDLSILSFFDAQRYLLLGTFTGLWKVDKRTGNMQLITKGALVTKTKIVPYTTWPQLIYEIIPADSGRLWLAGSSGLLYYNPKNDQSSLYQPDILIGGRYYNSIINIYDDHHGHLWTLTKNTFSVFDIATKTFKKYFYNDKINNITNDIPHGDIYRDAQGNFWLGSSLGLLYFNTAQKTFQYFTNNPKDTASLSFNTVECIVPDPNNPNTYLWVGTAGGGLNRFNIQTKKFTHFTIKNGLANNYIHGMIADRQGCLWISTNKGISRFDPEKKTFQNYDIREGLPSNEFNSGAYYRSPEGKLFFGSIHGFTAFYTNSIQTYKYAPLAVFTDFRLFNKSVVPGQKKGTPLKQSITATKQITLPYKDNIIGFQATALNYSNTNQIQYAYRLKNFSKKWINNGTDRLITFSNLNPGHYILQVKAANSDGVWSNKIAAMDLIILPPWWRTWWAYTLYILMLSTVLFYFRRYELKRIRLKNNLQFEHIESQKLKELDHVKSRFFANISHEFRTPLTLIIGPLEDVIQGGDPKKFGELVPEMHRNSKKLLHLINQLLDLSRLDTGNYSINTTREDIIPFVRQVVHSFFSLAERRNITLETEVDSTLRNTLNEQSNFYFDEDIIEKVLTNLLSNAFKFTPDGGQIYVSLRLHEYKQTFLELKVEDNGAGISAENAAYIFDRFYQADRSMKRQHEGSGIGLSLVKELVELHHGSISVNSEVNQGSIFTCLFPFNQKIGTAQSEAKSSRLKVEKTPLPELEKELTENETIRSPENKPLILVVEDQRDVRKYIGLKLDDTYTVMEAGSGKKGLEIALEQVPDLVISDVMMPEMDGFELCKKLKTNDLTSHIPVILLTARAADSDKMAGLETGADAYLIKPFNSRELRMRVKNLILLRNKMRAKFSNKLVVRPSEIGTTSADQEFMQKLLSVMEKHIGDAKFSVDQLAEEMRMSASQLYRKLKALINQSTQQFIRSVRMQRAMELLKEGAGTVSEISWKVGFEDPGYFSKVFKKQFDCLPSEKEKFP